MADTQKTFPEFGTDGEAPPVSSSAPKNTSSIRRGVQHVSDPLNALLRKYGLADDQNQDDVIEVVRKPK